MISTPTEPDRPAGLAHVPARAHATAESPRAAPAVEPPREPPPIDPAEAARNFRLGVWNGILFQVGEGLIDPSTVIPVLLTRLTTSSAVIGCASSLSDFGWLLPQALFASWAARRPRQIGLYRGAAVVRGLGLLLVAALALPLAQHPRAMLAVFFLGYGAYAFGGGAGAVAFMEIVGRTVPKARLTPLWAQRLFWGGLLSAGGALFVRRVLSIAHPGARFAILFGGALLLASTGWILFGRIREPALPPPPHPPSTRDLLRRGRALLRSDTPFRRLVMARSVLNVWFTVSPFMVLFAVRDLGGEARAAGTMLIARIAGFVLGNLVWQPLARRRGNRAIMVIGTLGAGTLALAAAALAVLSPWRLAWITAPRAVLGLEAVAFFGGAVHSGLSVGFASLSIELAPPGERQAFVSLVNTWIAPTLLLPMLGGALIDRTSAPLLFTLCGALAFWGSREAFKLPHPHELAAAAEVAADESWKT